MLHVMFTFHASGPSQSLVSVLYNFWYASAVTSFGLSRQIGRLVLSCSHSTTFFFLASALLFLRSSSSVTSSTRPAAPSLPSFCSCGLRFLLLRFGYLFLHSQLDGVLYELAVLLDRVAYGSLVGPRLLLVVFEEQHDVCPSGDARIVGIAANCELSASRRPPHPLLVVIVLAVNLHTIGHQEGSIESYNIHKRTDKQTSRNISIRGLA